MATKQQDSYGTFPSTQQDPGRSRAHDTDPESVPFLSNDNDNDGGAAAAAAAVLVPPALTRPLAKVSVTLTPLNLLTTVLALALAGAAASGLLFSYREHERYIAPGPPLYRRPVAESGVGRLPCESPRLSVRAMLMRGGSHGVQQ
jgi:hypothetical protein